MNEAVLCTAAEMERLETIVSLVAALLADERNKVMSIYRIALETKLKEMA